MNNILKAFSIVVIISCSKFDLQELYKGKYIKCIMCKKEHVDIEGAKRGSDHICGGCKKNMKDCTSCSGQGYAGPCGWIKCHGGIIEDRYGELSVSCEMCGKKCEVCDGLGMVNK